MQGGLMNYQDATITSNHENIEIQDGQELFHEKFLNQHEILLTT